MRVLLSTIGTRGDVQPLLALALQLKTLGREVRLCVPPDFRDWIEGFGIPATPIGPELRSTGKTVESPAARPTPAEQRQMMESMVADQYETVTAAARDCDAIVAATGLQIATRSVAEKMGIPYIFAAFCPAVLPSPHHMPPVYGLKGQSPAPATADNRKLWAQDAAVFNDSFNTALNSIRASAGLAPVSDVRSHIFTGMPWLAADPILSPWPDPTDQPVFQMGAWILHDERPLPPELETFLANGEPPVYFGLGSIRAPQGFSQAIVNSARAIGRRAIISRGWADLSVIDNEDDCLAIGEVSHQALFKRVAAVVHHGGAGTTTAAALAGVPQVVVPQMFDQYYWAQRISLLGIGSAHEPGAPTADSLTSALEYALRPGVAASAKSVSFAMSRDGALAAARRLLAV